MAKQAPQQQQERRVLDSPVAAAFRTVDNKDQVESIVRAHDQGHFYESAAFVDEMMTDDRIQGVTEQRADALMSCDVLFEAADDSAKAQEVRDIVGGKGDAHGLWRRMMPPEEIAQLLHWGWFLGVGVSQLVWTYDKDLDLQIPRLSWWHPSTCYWDWSARRFLLSTLSASIVQLPDTTINHRSDGQWVVWTPNGMQYGWRRGLIRSLALKYIVRQWNETDWARFNERHGLPVLKAKVPQSQMGETAESAFVGDLSRLNADAVVRLPQGEEGGASFDLEWAELQSRNWESFKALKDDLGDDIAVAVVGQPLTTSSEGGSYALGKVQNLVRWDKVSKDAEIAHALREQLLTHFAQRNFGDHRLAPRMSYKLFTEAEELSNVQKDQAVGSALISLQSAGVPVDELAYAQRHGIALEETDEREDAEAVTVDVGEGQTIEAKRKNIITAAENAKAGDAEEPTGESPEDGSPPVAQAALGAKFVVKRYTFAGLPIAIENPTGSTRYWTDEAGKQGKTTMRFDYGYIEGHLSGDGEELDVYIGPDENATRVYVVHQLKAPDFKRHDEDKVMLGFASEDEARRAYAMHRNDGERAIGGMSAMPLERFKAKLRRRSGTGKIRATVDAQLRAAPAAKIPKPKKTRSGRDLQYNDAMERAAKRHAAKAFKPDLSVIQRMIGQASSFEDLRKRLTTFYASSATPEQLASLVERVGILARLNGRLGAAEDL